MIKNPRKRCEAQLCKNIATHGDRLKQQTRCESHAQHDDYNFAERLCSKCGRVDILNQDGDCVSFCSFVEADKKLRARVKRKEAEIDELFEENIASKRIKIALYSQDKIIDSACTKQRPDFVFHCGSHVVIVEVDEKQHSGYTSCGSTPEQRFLTERRRMFNIFQSFDGLPVHFIRYNPDNFKGKKRVSDSERQETLLKVLEKSLESPPENGLSVRYLFYDSHIPFFQTIDEQDVL